MGCPKNVLNTCRKTGRLENTCRNIHDVFRCCVAIKDMWAKGLGKGIAMIFCGLVGHVSIETHEFSSSRSMRQPHWKKGNKAAICNRKPESKTWWQTNWVSYMNVRTGHRAKRIEFGPNRRAVSCRPCWNPLLLQHKRSRANIIPEKHNGFAMKIIQDPLKFKNHCFYNTKDRVIPFAWTRRERSAD